MLKFGIGLFTGVLVTATIFEALKKQRSECEKIPVDDYEKRLEKLTKMLHEEEKMQIRLEAMQLALTQS